MRYVILALVALTAQVLRGQGPVSGRVTDTDGGTLPGVSIALKETPWVCVAADLKGRYHIPIKTFGRSTLVFKYITCEPREVVVEPNGRPVEINVILLPITGECKVAFCGRRETPCILTRCPLEVIHAADCGDGWETVRRIPVQADIIPQVPEATSKLVVYPNPSYDGRIALRFENLSSTDAAKVEVTDASGALVHVEWMPSTTGTLVGPFDLGADLPAGVYLVTATVQDQRLTQRLVKY